MIDTASDIQEEEEAILILLLMILERRKRRDLLFFFWGFMLKELPFLQVNNAGIGIAFLPVLDAEA